MEKKYLKQDIKNHFTYRFWVYIVILAAGWFVCDLAYTMTEYRPPADRKVDFEIVAPGFADVEILDALIGPQVLSSTQQIDPSLEAVSYFYVSYSGDQQADMYGNMKFTVLMAAGEGNVWLMPRDLILGLNDSGAFIPLDDMVEAGILDVTGIDLSSGYLPQPSGKVDEDNNPLPADGPERLYALPMEGLQGLEQLGIPTQDLYAVIMNYCPNPQTSAAALNSTMQLLRDGLPQQTTQEG